MTFIDRLVERYAPERQLRRERARIELEQVRAAKKYFDQFGGFENSYKQGLSTRLSETYTTATGMRFDNESDRAKLRGARDRAYSAYSNNPVAAALVDTETDNVIGDGLNYQPQTGSKEWDKEAKDKYYEWLESCSVRGSDIHPGCSIERLLWSQSRIAGDIGWMLVSRGADSHIQIVPSENIVTPDDMRQRDSDVRDGIRFDSFGRPKAFFVMTYDDITGRKTFTEIQSRDFVYLPHYTRPTQTRGATCFLTIEDLLAHLDRYVDGVSLAAWMATVMGIIFKQNNSAKQMAALSTLTNSAGDQQKAITFENGMVKYIGTDEEVAQVQPHQPMQQTPDFIRAMFRMIGQPFRMPLEVIAMDMSTCNFASARIGLLPFYRSCRIKGAFFASHWSRTIRWWLSRERQRDRSDPKRWKTTFPDNYWKHELIVNAWDYTDPVSEAQSDLLQIDMGTKSAFQVISERGRDAEQIIADRKEWAQKTKDLPLVNSTMTRHPQLGVGAQGDPLGKEQVEPPEPAQPDKPEPAAQLVAAFAKDKDKRDALWNATDIPVLLKDAGISLDGSVNSADGEGIPMMPSVVTEE